MMTALTALYLKLNFLLLAAFLLWQASKWLAACCGQSLRFNTELKLARGLFVATLLSPLVLLLPEQLTRIEPNLPGLTVLAQSMAAGIDTGLAQNFGMGDSGVPVFLPVLMLLVVGMGWQFLLLVKQYRQLSLLLANSTPLRTLNGVHIVFSPEITTPFSTRALGRNHIVLPYNLLHMPRTLVLALKHELQHVRNGDLRWVLLMEALKPLLFWNPAWHAWHNEFHCLQEYACDEALLSRTSVKAQAYGNCLLDVASRAAPAAQWAASNMVPHFALFRSAHHQLLGRIQMLQHTRSNNFSTARTGLYVLFLLLGFGCATEATLDGDGQATPLIPQNRVNPDYPQAALQQRLVGWAVLEFDIDTDGGVINASVIDSCVVPQVFDPALAANEEGCLIDSTTFNASAVAAIRQWRYDLPVGEAAVREDVQTVIRFMLEDGTVENREDGTDLIRSMQEQYKARDAR